MFRLSITLFSFLILSGCVDIFELDLLTEEQNKLIVNGAVTTLAGPQEIRVYRSRDYDDIDGQSFAVRDAMVYVVDDLGNRFDFSLMADDLQKTFCVDLERDLGSGIDLGRNYRYVSSDDFRGEIGRTYTLYVELADGTKVVSTPELISPPIPIGELIVDYVIDETLGQGKTVLPDDKWIVKATLDARDASDEDVYLTWRHRGTFSLQANPELYCDFRDCGSPGVCIPGCCSQCWVVEYGQTLINTSSSSSQRLSENDLTVASIPIIGMRTISVYHLDLYQYRISSDVYDFFEALNQQLTNQGSVFDPPPYDENSNLTYEDGRDEPILGYFWAAGATHEVLNISPTTVTRQYNYFFPDDCQKVPGAGTKKPDYYPY